MQPEKVVPTSAKVSSVKGIMAVKRTKPSYNEMFEEFLTLYNEGLARSCNKTGGQTRGKKGSLGVVLTEKMVEYAAIRAGLDFSKLNIEREVRFPIEFFNGDYLTNAEVNTSAINNIMDDLEEHDTDLKVDVGVFYNGELILGIEAKAYMDAAMLKKFMFEVKGIKDHYFPTARFAVLQLENSLGGDYAEDKAEFLGSPTAHGLMAMLNTPVEIRTLLDGKRSSSKPIHQKGFYKPLNKYKFFSTLNAFSEILTKQTERRAITLR